MVWSIISNIEANAIDINPNGIKLEFGRSLNFLIDLKANINGMTIACMWAKNKILKNTSSYEILKRIEEFINYFILNCIDENLINSVFKDFLIKI